MITPSNPLHLSRQQLLDGSRRLHANDVEPTPTGVNYYRSHPTPFDFESCLTRFQGQDSPSLLSEASADAQKNRKLGTKHLWTGIVFLLLGFAGCLLREIGLALLIVPLFIFGGQRLFIATDELAMASSDEQFIAEIQLLCTPSD